MAKLSSVRNTLEEEYVRNNVFANLVAISVKLKSNNNFKPM